MKNMRMLILTMMIAAVAPALGGIVMAMVHVGEKIVESEPKGPEANCGVTPTKMRIVDLPPIITNLANPSDTWIRLEASVIFDPMKIADPGPILGALADDFLAFSRTLRLNQLSGAGGMQSLRGELNARAAARSESRIESVVLRTMVVQ